jgi:hypothetical protein
MSLLKRLISKRAEYVYFSRQTVEVVEYYVMRKRAGITEAPIEIMIGCLELRLNNFNGSVYAIGIKSLTFIGIIGLICLKGAIGEVNVSVKA